MNHKKRKRGKNKQFSNAAVLIDFGYLEKIGKKLTGLEKEHYKLQSLAINLCQRIGLWCEDIYFYYAPPFQYNKPTEEQANKKSLYDKYIHKIKTSIPPVYVREGRLQQIGTNQFRQKGVDTLLTYDLLRITQIRKYEAVILITADTDFAPIISNIKEDYPHSRIILAYYTDRLRNSPFSLSNHLWKEFTEKITISKKDFFMENKPITGPKN